MSSLEDEFHLSRPGGHQHTCCRCRITRVCYNLACESNGTEEHWTCGLCLMFYGDTGECPRHVKEQEQEAWQ